MDLSLSDLVSGRGWEKTDSYVRVSQVSLCVIVGGGCRDEQLMGGVGVAKAKRGGVVFGCVGGA